jgi:hypothetical protein
VKNYGVKLRTGIYLRYSSSYFPFESSEFSS